MENQKKTTTRKPASRKSPASSRKSPIKTQDSPAIEATDPQDSPAIEATDPQDSPATGEQQSAEVVYLGQYTKQQEKHGDQEVLPTWKYKDTVFVAGPTRPKSDTSRMGVVWKLAEEAGEEGITGTELARKLRHWDWGDSRSKYCQGLPPVGWAEGYVNGAVSPKQGHLVFKSK